MFMELLDLLIVLVFYRAFRNYLTPGGPRPYWRLNFEQRNVNQLYPLLVICRT